MISRPDPGPRRIGNALDRLLGSMRAPSVDVLDSVFSRWEEIVGAELAGHTQPAAIDGDQLVVSVDDPTWALGARETTLLRPEITGRGAANHTPVTGTMDRP